MSTDARSVVLLVAGILFVTFLVLQLFGLPGAPAKPAVTREARQRLAEHKARARQPELSKQERAAALRSAAEVALSELGRPGLATSLARRAERLDPSDVASVSLLVRALRGSSRLRALEDLLWKRLAEGDQRSPHYAKVLEELAALYDGPLARREIARALRRLGAAKS